MSKLKFVLVFCYESWDSYLALMVLVATKFKKDMQNMKMFQFFNLLKNISIFHDNNEWINPKIQG